MKKQAEQGTLNGKKQKKAEEIKKHMSLEKCFQFRFKKRNRGSTLNTLILGY